MRVVYYNGNVYYRHPVCIKVWQGTIDGYGHKTFYKAMRHLTNYPWQ